jgi:hypothetical protein
MIERPSKTQEEAQEASAYLRRQRVRTFNGFLRLEVLLVLKIMGESGPTEVAKQISNWRGQSVGRSAVGEHLIRLWGQGLVSGKKKTLDNRSEHAYVNVDAHATYSLTDQGWLASEKILEWMDSVRESRNQRLMEYPFA